MNNPSLNKTGKEKQNILSRKIAVLAIALSMLVCVLMTVSCSSKGGDESEYSGPFDGREEADLSGYESMEDYSGEIMLVDTTVAEMDELMDAGESFVVFFSYEDCPYCNRLMPYLNEAAEKAGVKVGYIDTRSNPEWMSNMDIDGYDIVTKRLKKYLSKDEDGKLHLYTPDMYFIKGGKVADRHEGVTEGADDPSEELTSSQEETLMKDLAASFEAIK